MSVVPFMSHIPSNGGAAAAQVTHASHTPSATAAPESRSRQTEAAGQENVPREFPGVKIAISDRGIEQYKDSREGAVQPTDAPQGRERLQSDDSREKPEDFAVEQPLREKVIAEAEEQRAKRQAEIQERQAKAEAEAEAKKDAQQEIASLTGYTGQQIELLYRQGRISYTDYTTEMDSREELRQQRDNLSVDFQKGMREAFVREENLQRRDAEGKIASLRKEDSRRQEDFFLQLGQAVI